MWNFFSEITWKTVLERAAFLWVVSVVAIACSPGCSEKKTKEEPPPRRVEEKKPDFDPEHPGESRAARAISQRILFQRGEEALKIEEHGHAVELFRKAAEIIPNTELAARAHLMLGKIWAEKDDIQRSLAALKQASVISDKDATILHELALAYEQASMNENAWKTIRNAFDLKKDDLEITADAARLALGAGKEEIALKMLHKFERGRNRLIKEAIGAFPDGPPESEKVAEQLRLTALNKLAGVPDTHTATAAWTLLKDRSAEVRKTAALILGHFGYKESLEHLAEALKTEKDPDVKDTISKAIEAIKRNPLSFQDQ